MSEDSLSPLTNVPVELAESPAADFPARLRRLDHELEFLRKLHLQAVVGSDRAQGLAEALLKQVASYRAVAGEQMKVWAQLGRAEGEAAEFPAALADLWEALVRVPELSEVLDRREVKEKILARILALLDEKEGPGEKASSRD